MGVLQKSILRETAATSSHIFCTERSRATNRPKVTFMEDPSLLDYNSCTRSSQPEGISQDRVTAAHYSPKGSVLGSADERPYAFSRTSISSMMQWLATSCGTEAESEQLTQDDLVAVKLEAF